MKTMKEFTAFSMAAILAYFEPINGIMTAVLVLFVLNFGFGLMGGIMDGGKIIIKLKNNGNKKNP